MENSKTPSEGPGEKIQVASREKDGFTAVTFRGRLEYGTIQTAKQLMEAVSANTRGFLLDMNEVERIDSTGFGFLVNFAKRVESAENVPIVIVVQQERIRELFAIAKLDQVFTLVPSESEGLEVLRLGDKDHALKLKDY